MKSLVFSLSAVMLAGCAPYHQYAFNTDGVSPATQVVAGPTGATGAAGTNGIDGINGVNGVNGANGNGFNSGLLCDAYTVLPADVTSNINWFKMFTDGTEKFSTVLSNFNVSNEIDTTLFQNFTQAQQNLIGTVNWALDCSGYIDIPADGYYTFVLSSDDGSELVIDENSLINMPQTQAMTSGTVNNLPMYSGRHTFNVLYFQSLATNIGLTLQWQGPANIGLGTLAVIPTTQFSH